MCALGPTPPAMHSIPLLPFSETLQGLACVHHLLAWTLPGYEMKIRGEFVSAEGQMEVFRECQNSKTLLPSLFTLLAVVVCPQLLSLCRLLLNCTVLPALISRLQIDYMKEELKKREAVFYIVSSPSGCGEFLLHTVSFSCLRHCCDLPQP